MGPLITVVRVVVMEQVFGNIESDSTGTNNGDPAPDIGPVAQDIDVRSPRFAPPPERIAKICDVVNNIMKSSAGTICCRTRSMHLHQRTNEREAMNEEAAQAQGEGNRIVSKYVYY